MPHKDRKCAGTHGVQSEKGIVLGSAVEVDGGRRMNRRIQGRRVSPVQSE